MEDKLISQKPLLTIAIPTYNRPEAIQKQIRLILPQLNDNVKLIVYDNHSSPPVAEYMTDAELGKFSLVRNNVNVGADANIARCFENCDTKWLWTLSDDDFIKCDAVEYLLEMLKNKSESVFLNFCKGLSFQTIGFQSFAEKFSNPTVYSSSFTMSSCVYNIEKLQSSLVDYYSNLSSMVGTIILVLKYVQKNSNACCEFIDETLICSYNTVVGWDYRTYVKRSRLFVEAFDQSTAVVSLRKTLFLGCFLTNYWLILNNRNKRKVTERERWKLFWLTMNMQGIGNALIQCPAIIIKGMLHFLAPKLFKSS